MKSIIKHIIYFKQKQTIYIAIASKASFFNNAEFEGNGYIFRGSKSANLCCLPFENGSTLKVKNTLPLRNVVFFFFPLRADPFQNGLGVQESKEEATKIVSLVKNSGKSTTVFTIRIWTDRPEQTV